MNIAYPLLFLGLFLTVFSLLVFLQRDAPSRARPPGHWPRVTFAIPAHNEERDLAACLDAVLALDYPRGQLDVIVVDDGSTDGTPAIARRYARRGVRVFSQKQAGKAAALNFMLSKARGEWFATLDADSFVERDSLKTLLAPAIAEGAAAAISGVRVFEPRTLVEKFQRVEYAGLSFARRVYSLLDAVDVTPGPLSVFRTRVLRGVKGFDEASLAEDQEMALRLQSRHHRILSVPEAVVSTRAPPSFGALFRQRVRWIRGGVRNLLHYFALLRPAYGDLGVLILPVTLFTLVVLPYFFLLLIADLAAGIPGLLLSGRAGDAAGLAWYGLTPVRVLIGFTILLSGVWVLIAVKRVGAQSLSLLALITYLVSQPLFFTAFWVGSLLEELRGAAIRWK